MHFSTQKLCGSQQKEKVIDLKNNNNNNNHNNNI